MRNYWNALKLFLSIVWREWEPPRKNDAEWNKYRIKWRMPIRFAWEWATSVCVKSGGNKVRGVNDPF